MKTILVALGAVLALSIPAVAQDAAQAPSGGTNFPALKDYPAAACVKPAPLPKQPVTTIASEIQRYNVLVANYNKLGSAYIACVNEYVGNANRDMDIIRQKSRAATDEANRKDN